MDLPQRLSCYLEDLEHPIGRGVNLAIAVLVMLSAGIFVAETYSLPKPISSVLNLIDASILVVFVVEYLLRLAAARDRLRYFFSPYALIDLLAVLPYVLGLADIRFLRVFRWFRILRLVRFLQGRTLLGAIGSENSLILIRIGFTLVSIIFVYAGLIYQVEHANNPQVFGTFLDAVYFSVVTMTTVGFGDVTPRSEIGRLLTLLMILTGVALIPWQVGDLIRQLVRPASLREQPCPQCCLPRHDWDAQFCKRCGAALPPASVLVNSAPHQS